MFPLLGELVLFEEAVGEERRRARKGGRSSDGHFVLVLLRLNVLDEYRENVRRDCLVEDPEDKEPSVLDEVEALVRALNYGFEDCEKSRPWRDFQRQECTQPLTGGKCWPGERGDALGRKTARASVQRPSGLIGYSYWVLRTAPWS